MTRSRQGTAEPAPERCKSGRAQNTDVPNMASKGQPITQTGEGSQIKSALTPQRTLSMPRAKKMVLLLGQAHYIIKEADDI